MNKKRILIPFLLLFLLLIPVVFSEDAITDPLNIKLTNWVNDKANVISAEQEAQINSIISQLQKDTTAEIAVITISDLGDNEIRDLALQLGEGVVGNKKLDNGIIILISINDRKWTIEVGYGLEGRVTDIKSGRIGREVLVPYFQKGDYGSGLLEAVTVLDKEVRLEADEYWNSKEEQYASTTSSSTVPSFVVFIIFIIFFIISFVIPILAFIYTAKQIHKGVTKKKGKKEDETFWTALFAASLFSGSGRHGRGGFGGGSFGGGGGFGGFGGGSFGGGGASGGW